MRMRTFIHVKPTNMSVKTVFHARYISEREEPQSRSVFTHDRDGLKYKAADCYLAGGSRPRARTSDLIHVIIAFNVRDARDLERLGKAAVAALKDKSSIFADCPADQSAKIEDSNAEL